MSSDDADRWDGRYVDRDEIAAPGPPAAFAHVTQLFPTSGTALEIACGTGQASRWLAERGMTVDGVDVSPVAIATAQASDTESGACRFAVHDLDNGLPDGDAVDLLLCHMFRDPDLDGALIERLKPGGLLAIAVLSEVGAEPGRFRARPGALTDAFGELEILESGEGDGRAWLLARR